MARVTFSSGEVPTVSKMNSLADQCVIQSNSAPSSPLEGMLWYDTNAAHPLVYAYNGSDWFPLPMGLMAKSSIANTGTGPIIAGTYVTVNGSTLTFDAEADQRYRYSADIHWLSNEADDIVAFQLQTTDDGSTWTDSEDAFYDRCVGDNLLQRISIQSIDTPGTTLYGWRVQVKTYFAVSGACQINGGTDCTVEHIGSGTLATSSGL